MSEPVRSGSLYDAIENLPEGVVGEIIDGQVHTHPRPAGRHGDAASVLLIDLGGPFYRGRGGPGGWRLIAEPEVHFQRDAEVLVPDIAGWRRERLPEVPDDQRFEVVPDWVCEVLSPSIEATDRAQKMRVYARYGVPHAWLVDPREKSVEAYALAADGWQPLRTVRGESAIEVAPFAEVPIPAPWT